MFLPCEPFSISAENALEIHLEHDSPYWFHMKDDFIKGVKREGQKAEGISNNMGQRPFDCTLWIPHPSDGSLFFHKNPIQWEMNNIDWEGLGADKAIQNLMKEVLDDWQVAHAYSHHETSFSASDGDYSSFLIQPSILYPSSLVQIKATEKLQLMPAEPQDEPLTYNSKPPERLSCRDHLTIDAFYIHNNTRADPRDEITHRRKNRHRMKLNIAFPTVGIFLYCLRQCKPQPKSWGVSFCKRILLLISGRWRDFWSACRLDWCSRRCPVWSSDIVFLIHLLTILRPPCFCLMLFESSSAAHKFPIKENNHIFEAMNRKQNANVVNKFVFFSFIMIYEITYMIIITSLVFTASLKPE